MKIEYHRLIGGKKTVEAPHDTLDLLLGLSPQVLAEAAPVENREPSPEVALDPILGLLNVSFTHHTWIYRVSPFCARLPQARACLFSLAIIRSLTT